MNNFPCSFLDFAHGSLFSASFLSVLLAVDCCSLARSARMHVYVFWPTPAPCASCLGPFPTAPHPTGSTCLSQAERQCQCARLSASPLPRTCALFLRLLRLTSLPCGKHRHDSCTPMTKASPVQRQKFF